MGIVYNVLCVLLKGIIWNGESLDPYIDYE